MAVAIGLQTEAEFNALPYVDLRPVLLPARFTPSDPVDPDVARLIPEAVAARTQMLPFSETASVVHMAIARPLDEAAYEALSSLDISIQLWRTHPAHLRVALERIWSTSNLSNADSDGQVLVHRSKISRLGEIMVDHGLISPADLRTALRTQARSGGKLGSILVSSNQLSPISVAAAVARQNNLPLVDLLTVQDGRRGLDFLDPALFAAMPAEFWRDRQIIPLERHNGSLTVAMLDPNDLETIRRLSDVTRLRIRPMVTGERDIKIALERVYGTRFTEESRAGLVSRHPENSAATTLSRDQRWWMVGLGLLLVVSGLLWPLPTVVALIAFAQIYYVGMSVYKMGLATRAGLDGDDIHISTDEVENLRQGDLPVYTVLVPAFREAAVLPILARALTELDYPHDRLDVKLLLEEDDQETLRVARDLRLPNFISIVTVPKSDPQTKPKACNYGLQLARGEFTVIYDAEDIPEPDQLLKAVAAFRQADPDVVCIQAKLAYFNQHENILTRWFTAEYLMWFDLLLPALHRHNLPIPLGGTSNHFRTDVLRQVGAWDPFNVAEDADLGVRLHKLGFRTAIMDSITYEEANSQTGNWIRQRSRWVKGYMQTWLVHMRSPVELWRSMGSKEFLSFQIVVGGTPLTLLLNPVFATMTTLWYLTHSGMVESMFPTWIYLVAAANLVIGNFAFTYANMVATARRNLWDLVAWTALSPIYWSLMSLAAWKALYQLVTRPSYWEKTDHGLTSALDIPLSTEQRLSS